MWLRRHGALLFRLAAIAGVLLAEMLIRESLLGGVFQQDYFPLQRELYRLPLAWAGALAILTAAEGSGKGAAVAARLAGHPPQVSWLVVHFVLIAPVVLQSYLAPAFRSDPVIPLQILQHVLLAAAVLALLLAFVPARLWRELLGGSSRLSLVALLLAAGAVLILQASEDLWQQAAAVTFHLVRMMLAPFYPGLQLLPASLSIITAGVEIHVDKACSGLEGVGLMLVFCAGWLWHLRHEFRLPRALLVLPVAALSVFLLNSVRIAMLVALATQGYVKVALAGFHSQAGWIFFIGAAFLVALLSRRIAWLRNPATAVRPPRVSHTGDDTSAFLLPLLLMLAAGMVTRAMSAGIDQLQWLRLPIGAAILLLYRDRYANLDWRCSWRGVAAGVAVFVAWILAAHWLSPRTAMPEALAQLPPLQRCWWITARALLAVLAVPIAEELAFRGFLMRRLMAANFIAVPIQSVKLRALLLSSLLFGLSHGSYWLPGIFAGLAFGGVAVRTGRFGEAVAAHVTANALLAALVLVFGQWQYW
ncbi:MAG TPA: exosortase E/protease, VPEID-CTERM system [Steroidobacteraceae bacterium]|nr:exosortase E/protease, VPEID-CTERM system [Steroidobacteraceae bacterium]